MIARWGVWLGGWQAGREPVHLFSRIASREIALGGQNTLTPLGVDLERKNTPPLNLHHIHPIVMAEQHRSHGAGKGEEDAVFDDAGDGVEGGGGGGGVGDVAAGAV